MEVVARFAREKDLKYLLEKGYKKYEANGGSVIIAPRIEYTDEDIFFDLESLLCFHRITMKGIDCRI